MYMMLVIVLIWLPVLATGKHARTAVWLSFIVFFLVSGLRDESVGTDTQPYMQSYLYYGKRTLSESLKRGNSAPVYNLYCWVLYRFFPQEQAVLLFNSFLINFGYAYFINEFVTHKFRATLLYVETNVFFASMNVMRQEVSISLMLVALVLILSKRKSLLGLIVVGLSILIHNTTAVPVALLVVLYRMFKSREFKIGTVAVATAVVLVVVVVAYRPLADAFSRLFSRYNRYGDGTASEGIADRNSGRIRYIYVEYLLILIITLASAAAQRYIETNKGKLAFVGALSMVYLGVSMSGYLLFVRMLYSFTPFYICYMADVTGDMDDDAHSVITGLILMPLLSSCCIASLMLGHGGVTNYIPCFLG